jgi:hypothetical protein
MSSLNVRTTYHIYYFTFKLYFFVIPFFVTLKKNLVQTNFGFIVCYDLFNVNIEVISIQTLVDRRKLVEKLVLILKN